jgi:hypothetical protein
VLHVTNGGSTVATMRHTHVVGDIVAWADVLHEGPVPALDPAGLRAVRAQFLAKMSAADPAAIETELLGRDERLAAAVAAGERVVLWFEHDLYDQLQLIQVLDGLSALRGPPISLVCEAEYLGNMAPERAAELFSLRTPLTRRHFQEAQSAWAAFRSADPLQIDPSKPKALQFLGAALRRHLEEFPWTTDGLSRSQRQIREGKTQEEPAFLGDTVLAWYVERIDRWLPRWLGGYEVKDETVRWDPALSRLIRA